MSIMVYLAYRNEVIMGSLIFADIMFLLFSIYVAIFFSKFHTKYPDMSIGFHVWEVCYKKETWEFGNKFAAKVAIVLGILFFAIFYPILLLLNFERFYLTIMLIIFFILYFILLFLIVKLYMRKKFKLKDK